MQSNHLFTADFTSDFITLCVFEKSFKKIALKDTYIINISRFADFKEKSSTVTAEIRDFYFKNIKYITSSALILPRDETLIFFVDYPKAAMENLGNVIDFEIEKYVPFPKKDVAYSYKNISKTKTSIRVMIAATKKSTLNDYTGILERAGIKLDSIVVKTSALCNYPQVFKGLTENDALLVSASASRFELTHFKSGEIVSSKLVPITARAPFEETLQKEIAQLHISKPSIYLINNGVNTGSAGVDFKPVEFNESRIAVSGQLSANKDILTASICCAAGIFGIGDYNVNLIATEDEERQSALGNIITGILVAGVIASIIVWANIIFSVQTKKLELMSGYIENFKKNAYDVNALSEESEAMEKELALIENILKDDRNAQEILRELTLSVPKEAWLMSFDYKENKFYIRGYAESASELIFKLEDSPMFKDVSITSSIIKQGAGIEEFNIQGEVL